MRVVRAWPERPRPGRMSWRSGSPRLGTARNAGYSKVSIRAKTLSAARNSTGTWITDPEDGVSGARSEVLKRVWRLFKEHGIELPFPQLDLHLRDNAQLRQLIATLAPRNE